MMIRRKSRKFNLIDHVRIFKNKTQLPKKSFVNEHEFIQNEEKNVNKIVVT